MITLLILFLSIIALLFLVQQLLKNSPEGKFLKSIRDLLLIVLALGISTGVFYVGFILIRFLIYIYGGQSIARSFIVDRRRGS